MWVNGEVSPQNVTNMLSNSYDLYSFDQTSDLEWINFKNNGGFSLVPGKGYLYANSEEVTLAFTGSLRKANDEFTLTLDSGWNLVGNPFTVNAYIDRDFYKMNEDGTEIMIDSQDGAIAPTEGVFVMAEEDGETLSFSTTAPSSRSYFAINLNNGRSVIDRVIVRFGEGRQLPKFQLNPKNTKVYIPQDNKDFSDLCGCPV